MHPLLVNGVAISYENDEQRLKRERAHARYQKRTLREEQLRKKKAKGLVVPWFLIDAEDEIGTGPSAKDKVVDVPRTTSGPRLTYFQMVMERIRGMRPYPKVEAKGRKGNAV